MHSVIIPDASLSPYPRTSEEMDGTQELHHLKIHSRGGSYNTPGLGDLSNEGSKNFLSSLELVFKAAETFLDKFQILAGLSRAQKKQSSEFTEFSTKT